MTDKTESIQDWQSQLKEVGERNLYLLGKKLWCDCCFLVGSKPKRKMFNAHKIILAASSPVFETMFFGSIPETKTINLPDIPPQTFEAFLRYIYADVFKIEQNHEALDLYRVANKYMVPRLAEKCIEILLKCVNTISACKYYEFAKFFDEQKLVTKSLEIICQQTDCVLKNTNFDELELSTIFTIFEQNKLHISSELNIFNALPKIFKKQPNKKNKVCKNRSEQYATVQDFLKKVRFLTLTAKEFADGPANSDLLTQQEKYAILMNIVGTNNSCPMPIGFDTSVVKRYVHRDAYGGYYNRY